MNHQETRRTIEGGPNCDCKFTIAISGLQGRMRIHCHRCNKVIADWGKKPTPKVPPIPLDVTMSREMNLIGNTQAPVKKSGPSTITKTEIASQELERMGSGPKFKRIGEYDLIKLIGKGGMGEIYLGKHPQKAIYVAIKVLDPKIQSDEAARKRFLQEAKVHSRLCQDFVHPNIVQVYDVGYCSNTGRLYLAMEYIDGESLDQILESRKSISQKHSIKIAIAVAQALEHALGKKIIHRDLKPANIMIDRRTRKVKVTDLGLGKILEEKGATLSGEFMGTPYYTAPEQIRNARDVDQQADIYALGATLYNMICGRPPYSEHKGTINILRAKVTQEPIPLTEYAPRVHQEVLAVVEKSMAKDKGVRYQSPTEMIQDMKKVLEKIA